MADSLTSDATSRPVGASKYDLSDGAGQRWVQQHSKLPTCTVTRSKLKNSEKMEPTPSSPLYSKPSSVVLRIKQHPSSLEVHLPEGYFPSSSTTDSSDSDSSHWGATESSSTEEKRPSDEDSDAESPYNTSGVIESFAELENAHASKNRSILIHRMAEVALTIQLGPSGLYLAVQLLDLYWNHRRGKGKILDTVQLQVLALTCVHLANNCSCRSKRTPDEFCHLAGVAEGTVKGCMIVKQEVSLVALLGGPQKAAAISTWGLWLEMGHPANQQHLLQFVGLLKNSDFGEAHFRRDLMQAFHFPRTATTSNVGGLSAEAAKVINALLPTQGCASTPASKKRPLEKPIVFAPMKRSAAQG